MNIVSAVWEDSRNFAEISQTSAKEWCGMAQKPRGKAKPKTKATSPSPSPSPAEDEAALVGTWIHESELALLRFHIQSGFVAFVVSDKRFPHDFAVEDRDGQRVLSEAYYDFDGDRTNPLYAYQLRGDRLHLELLPNAAAQFAEDEYRRILEDLGGTWYRVRINKAETQK
jgi:hypothetical protein